MFVLFIVNYLTWTTKIGMQLMKAERGFWIHFIQGFQHFNNVLENITKTYVFENVSLPFCTLLQ